MSSDKPLILDFAQTDEMKLIFPRPAILSSHGAKWEGIHVEYHCQPPTEYPEQYYQQHAIGLMLNSAIIKGIENGKHHNSERWYNGDMFIGAAGNNYRLHTIEEHEFIALALNPTDFDNTVCESTNSNPIEIIPQWQIRDPLIHGIALTLKTELESGGLNGTLYVDALKNALSIHILCRYSQKPNLLDFEGSSDASKMQIVIDYINDCINRELYLSDLAKLVQLRYPLNNSG
ncbi:MULTISPECIES: hypothetical protein [unclassified Microcoleus]|uniref:hypothetical protein n=1 Tax=unclassified Microcoleus TaxID=2642155 RepID=UPI0025D69671|nr:MULTISPECIES: hypothetical protein [unclassified Microcoleus]